MSFIKTLFEKEKDNNDKIFIKNIAISIVAMLACVVMLCSFTWAWFETNTSSVENVVEAGSIDFDITVTDSSDAPVTIYKTDSNYTLSAAAGETYSITIKMTSDSTVSGGYCMLMIDGQYYKTDYVAKNQSLSFKICLDTAKTVIFTPTWGTPSNIDITADYIFTGTGGGTLSNGN